MYIIHQSANSGWLRDGGGAFGNHKQTERETGQQKHQPVEKALRWLWIKRGDEWSSTLLGHKPGPDHPRLGRLGEGEAQRPETPFDPGSFTEDVSKLHLKVFQNLNVEK